jgi:hypothetical protein
MSMENSNNSIRNRTRYVGPRHTKIVKALKPLNAVLNPICHLLALLGAHHIFHVSGLRVSTKMEA